MIFNSKIYKEEINKDNIWVLLKVYWKIFMDSIFLIVNDRDEYNILNNFAKFVIKKDHIT